MNTHKEAQRDKGRWGIPNATLPWLLPGVSMELLAHQRPISTNPVEHGHNGWWRKPKLWTQGKGHHDQALPRAVTGDPQSQRPGMKPIKISQQGNSPEHLFRGELLFLGVWDIKGHRGKAFQKYTRHDGMIRGETRERERPR